MSSGTINFITEIIIIWVLVGAVIGIIFVANKNRSPQPLPLKKPSLAFFPKYYIDLPSSGGRTESLETVMAQKGFRPVAHESGRKYFERGSVLGDFSIKWAKLRISEMESSPYRLSIAYGGAALFDTGDLWKFAKEIERILSSPE